MWAEFRQRVARYRGQIIGWGIGLALYGLLIIAFYPMIVDMGDQFDQLLKMYPPEMQAFLGDFSQMNTPSGWLSIEYFSLIPIISGIFAILSGSGLLATNEEEGTLDLIAAYPLSRTALFLGRLLAFIVALLLVLAIAWLGLYLPTLVIDFPATPLALARPMLSLFAFLMLFAGLALLLSMILPSRRMAARLTGGLLMLSYFISGLSEMINQLAFAADFSPYNYFQSGDAMNGLNWQWVLGLLVGGSLFILLAWWRFDRHDIRVAGEGGWSLRLRRPQRVG